MLILKLYNGRKDPNERLDDWGLDGPRLRIDWFVCTYMMTFRIGLPDGEEVWLDNWKSGEQDGIIVNEELFHYDGIYYGDWSIHDVEDDADHDGWFDEELAVLPGKPGETNVKVKVEVLVEYEPGTNETAAQIQLGHAMDHLASAGMLGGDFLGVETWDYKTEVITNRVKGETADETQN